MITPDLLWYCQCKKRHYSASNLWHLQVFFPLFSKIITSDNILTDVIGTDRITCALHRHSIWRWNVGWSVVTGKACFKGIIVFLSLLKPLFNNCYVFSALFFFKIYQPVCYQLVYSFMDRHFSCFYSFLNGFWTLIMENKLGERMQSLHKIKRSNVTGWYLSEQWYLNEKEVFTTTTKNVCIYKQIGAIVQKLPAIKGIACAEIPEFFF